MILDSTTADASIGRCLFTAPADFMAHVQADYQATLPTEFRQVWQPDQLGDCSEIRVWVVNPAQHFVVDENILPLFPQLKLLLTPSTGRNHIDLALCQRRKIAVLSLLDDRTGMAAQYLTPSGCGHGGGKGAPLEAAGGAAEGF